MIKVLYSINGTSDMSIPNLGINSINKAIPIIITANYIYNTQTELVINLSYNKVSVDRAIISCLFLRPFGVRPKVEPLNVVHMTIILPLIKDYTLSA